MYGPYLVGALWLILMLVLIALAAWCLLLARRNQGLAAPPVMSALAALLVAAAGIVWKESHMVLWQGAVGLLFLIALMFGQAPRSRRRTRGRYRY
jgi:membrane-bound ClpP family serine protease